MWNRANVYKLQWDLGKNWGDWDIYSEHARQTDQYAKEIQTQEGKNGSWWMDVDRTAKIRTDMMEDKIGWKVITH